MPTQLELPFEAPTPSTTADPQHAIRRLREKGVSGCTDYDVKVVLDYITELEQAGWEEPCQTPLNRR